MQYSLRSLGLFLAIVASMLAILSAIVRDQQRQAYAIQRLEANAIKLSRLGNSGWELSIDEKTIWDDQTTSLLSTIGRDVRQLNVYDQTLNEIQLNALFSIPGLRTATFCNSTLSLGLIAATDLKRLHLQSCTLSRSEASCFSSMKQLDTLYLSGLRGGNGVDHFVLPTMASLRKLHVESAIPTVVEMMPQLEDVVIVNTGDTKHGEVSLSTCPKVETASIWLYGGNPIDHLLSELAKTTNLETLEIGTIRVTASDVRGIADIKTLRKLSLRCGEMDNHAVRALSDLQQIERLFVSVRNIVDSAHSEDQPARAHEPAGGGVNDSVFKALAACENLRVLAIEHQFDTPDQLAWLADIRQIEFLDLDRVSIASNTNSEVELSDVPRVDELRFLKKLSIRKIGLAPAEVDALLPTTQVIRGVHTNQIHSWNP